MEYNFKEIEANWQKFWAEHKTFAAKDDSTKEKYYVLDMFPYPSGAGLHVGHPLGYIASDIVARFKRHKGFNVLHPMGYDSFGLPAEQYAIQTGQHPSRTTYINIDGCLDNDGQIKKEFVNSDGSIKKEALNNDGQIIQGYKKQLDKIGFSFDWDREVRTSNPDYYKWTQWIFIQLFNSWYNKNTNKAEPISNLISEFEAHGNPNIQAYCDDDVKSFTAEQWKAFTEKEQSDILMAYRMAYLGEAYVNWCPQLGTVLANDEIKDGVSERGGYPVERKLMKQWSMRITAYAQRLLDGLDTLDWTDSLKEAQRNWIGKSEGTSLKFKIVRHPELVSGSQEMLKQVQHDIEVFTTRPDTIFGVSFVTLAPEHELVTSLTTPENKELVEAYITQAKNRSERERQADINKITGVPTGSFVEHPFTGKQIPIWIGDYVLAGYGTGAVMAVPAHDSRDYSFAKHFGLPILEVVAGGDLEKESYDAKEGTLINSDFLNGLDVKAAMKKAISQIEANGLGKGKVNFRLRDAVFGRQRYWGEPIPIYYKNDIPYALSDSELPLVLPEVDKYLPTEDGEPPLARAKDWKYQNEFDYEHSTMPGWAGSSWYFLRYMDPHNGLAFADKKMADYWKQVDLYIGGSEHATGHLLYVRFWTKILNDLGHIAIDEPAKKLINQGMIQGRSNFVYRIDGRSAETVFWKVLNDSILNCKVDLWIEREVLIEKYRADFVINWKDGRKVAIEVKGQASSKITFDELSPILERNGYIFYVISNEEIILDLKSVEEKLQKILNCIDIEKYTQNKYSTPVYCTLDRINEYSHVTNLHVDINMVNNDILNIPKFLEGKKENCNAGFILDDNSNYVCGYEIEKMSKSKFNVQTPDDIAEKFGADTLRLYEMFLGPLEQSKPWNTNGITGVHGFLKKLWRLFYQNDAFTITTEEPTKAELKTLHKTIKKITEDIERFSFNTSVSNFMICVNELTDLKCNKKEILEPLLICLSPYAPHITEELWKQLGHTESIAFALFPLVNEAFLIDDSINYPVSVNGKLKFTLELPATLTKEEVEVEVMKNEQTIKLLAGQQPKKVIVVHKKIVNMVV